jgi:hypothetical protein
LKNSPLELLLDALDLVLEVQIKMLGFTMLNIFNPQMTEQKILMYLILESLPISLGKIVI